MAVVALNIMGTISRAMRKSLAESEIEIILGDTSI